MNTASPVPDQRLQFKVQHRISGHHPSLAGHFPGRPVVPAVVIIDEVVRLFASRHGAVILRGIPAAKFIRPLAPDQPFEIRCDEFEPCRVRFECRRADEVFAHGRLEFAPLGEAG